MAGAVARLRERVEDAVAEVERLRAQNAALAERVAALQQEMGNEALALPGGSDPEALRAKIEGFIAAIDDVLAVSEEPGSNGTEAP